MQCSMIRNYYTDLLLFEFYPCSRFLKKTAGSHRLIQKPSVRIGFPFCAFNFTDFSIISIENLIIMLVFIEKNGLLSFETCFLQISKIHRRRFNDKRISIFSSGIFN